MKKFTYSLLFGLFLFLGCEEKIPVEPIGFTPVISELSAPDTLYTESTQEYLISIRVSDPQGVGDIASVVYQILPVGSQNVIRTDTLWDNGAEGDIIPRDGLYTGKISAEFVGGQPGQFSLVFQAEDLLGHKSDTLVHHLVVMPGQENLPPVISQVITPAMIDLKSQGEHLISAQVSDPQGREDVDVVICQIYKPSEPMPSIIDTLRDDGTSGDPIASDGIYSRKITASFARNRVGEYSFRFQAKDRAGKRSNAIVKIVQVVDSGNLPPVIFNLVAPDTIVLASQTLTTRLTIDVMDPQGLSDVREVFFNSFLPDGRPSSGNPFQMKDDGNIHGLSGDQAAGDGRYSLIIQIPPETSQGNYTFIFQAVDRSNAVSNQITHIITIRK
ncbi:MAG: hypothetical protein ONB05_07680 [candidate division KSB1 bacterium]|nr:hypothetical protein [candidate division KSB1 bacterium]